MRVSRPVLVLLSLVTLAAFGGCREEPSSGETVVEGRAELVWSLSEGEPPVEPWFARIIDVEVRDDRVYVADWQRITVIVLDAAGNFVRTIGQEGEGPGEFRRIQGLALPPQGDLYVESVPLPILNRFTLDGEFVERLDHGQVTRAFEPDDVPEGWRVANPLIATDNSTFVWYVSPVRNAPAERQLETPPLLSISGDGAQFLGHRKVPDGSDGVREALIESPDQNLVSYFTSGEVIRGGMAGEVLFVRRADPYTVFRFGAERPEESFGYLDPERASWVQRLNTPFGESGSRSGRYRGDHIILQPERPPAVNHAFTFTHSLRGLARWEDKLMMYVEILQEGFPEQRAEEMVDKKLYVVDLDTERLEMVVSVDIPEFVWLEGALGNGDLVFATRRSDPSLYVVRIGAES